MAGAKVPTVDTCVALRAVASIDRLISESSDDHFLNDVLKSAAQFLKATQCLEQSDRSYVTKEAPPTLH